METRQLLKISKYVYKETFAQSVMDQAGSNQTKIQEKMEKNQKYMRSQSFAIKFAVIVVSLVLAVFPVIGFSQIKDAPGSYPADYLLWAGTLTLSLYFLAQVIFIVVLGMFFASSLLSGEQMKWLITLPLSEKEIQKIGVFAFIRGFDMQIATSIIIFPVVTYLYTKNLLLVLIGFLGSILSSLFALAILVFVGQKLQKLMNLNNPNSKKNNRGRLIALIIYIILIMTVSLSLNLGSQMVIQLFQSMTVDVDIAILWNILFAVIPFIFAPVALMVQIYIGKDFLYPISLVYPIIGIGIFALIVFILIRKAIAKVSNIIYDQQEEYSGDETKTTVEDIRLAVNSPVKAFFEKDKNMATRDIQMLMMIIMPYIMQIIGQVATIAIPEEGQGGPMLFTINLMYTVLLGTMVMWGALSVEGGGATINQALPINVRDQVNAKMRWAYTILPTASFIPVLFAIGKANFVDILITNLIILPIGPIIALMTLELKVLMFGKLKYKYVIEDVNIKNKAWKWILIGVIDILVLAAIETIMVIQTIGQEPSIGNIVMIIVPLEIGFTVLLLYFYNKLFPKPKIYQ